LTGALLASQGDRRRRAPVIDVLMVVLTVIAFALLAALVAGLERV
jgi:hypothetical protein